MGTHVEAVAVAASLPDEEKLSVGAARLDGDIHDCGNAPTEEPVIKPDGEGLKHLNESPVSEVSHAEFAHLPEACSASFQHGDPSDSPVLRKRRGSESNAESVSGLSSGPDHERKENDTFSPKSMSLFSYLYSEMTRGYWLEHDEAKYTEKRKRVYTFMKTPRELEKFMVYGFFQCLDAFLYIFTFLPLRFIMALINLVIRICFSSCWTLSGRLLEPAQICDLLKGVILIVCCLLLNYVDVSMMYHLVRGQAIIKLYIFFNMLEVADRLFSSFGQDILDSLFWTATEPRGRKREHIGVLPHLILAVLYVFLHAILVLFQATTLNVAFNSYNKALLTIMMSNNFVELKGSVFKRFEKNNLFQMSCSDVRERFHLIVLFGIVGVRNMTELSWNMDHLSVLIPNILLVLISEVIIDCLKHAFITKFNEIPSEVYREYTVSIAYDLANSRQKNAFSDLVDVVSRRMGFIPLPLAALLIRVVSQSVRFKGYITYAVIAMAFCCLLTLKVLNSIILMGKSYDYIQANKDQASSNDIPKPREITRSKSFSEVRFDPDQKPVDSARDAEMETRIKRSKSLGSHINSPKAVLFEDTTSKADLTPPIAESLTPKVLFHNSTVSLQSVSLNEEFIRDRQTSGQEASPVSTSNPRSGQQNSPEKKPKNPPKPLSEIDRYTMCSNRII